MLCLQDPTIRRNIIMQSEEVLQPNHFPSDLVLSIPGFEIWDNIWFRDDTFCEASSRRLGILADFHSSDAFTVREKCMERCFGLAS
ncbi:hypothetical protein BD324DRAFT_640377 [Kockovaella imperatae]|uniref:Uncharacterized protein n=1 Tax=Kockovaella imperatae TaxID=4999 RepID=A0A1Y1U5E8_9TREE|nr:hypothetical protein BD324DRAFT_640377 [Kockovaella imperatae]ORX33253.1 hypothetical protein BD324DRAFT_640377 [Kockovaella imperatae]